MENIQRSTFDIRHPAGALRVASGAGRWLSNAGSLLLILVVRLYRGTLSPAKIFFFGPMAGCRFEPSCSQYAMDALKTHGAILGSWLAAKRICRCHPWGDCGCDPVPPKRIRQAAPDKAETPVALPPAALLRSR